jgi:large subunit ribosomal protein L9
MLKVILLESIDNLGSIGDVVSVRDGYARNYLFPRDRAVLATPGELAKIDSRRAKITTAKIQELDRAKAIADGLKGLVLRREVKVGDEGRLYGSVGVGDIVDLMQEKGHALEKKQVLLPEPIREVGTYTVPIRLHHDVEVEITVEVVAEKEEE